MSIILEGVINPYIIAEELIKTLRKLSTCDETEDYIKVLAEHKDIVDSILVELQERVVIEKIRSRIRTPEPPEKIPFDFKWLLEYNRKIEEKEWRSMKK